MKYIDLHCDSLTPGYFKGLSDIYAMENTNINIQKLRQAECKAQVFAVFFPERGKDNPYFRFPGSFPPDMEFFAGMRKLLMDTIDKHKEEMCLAVNAAQLREAEQKGKLAAFLTMEDGRALEGSLDQLEYFWNQGVRLITLTWNGENWLGSPNSSDDSVMQKGLKDFGRQAVERMNELGILIDVSHLSDGGFYDVAAISRAPFIASHSNARAIAPHQRNLTDDMIRILGERQGVAGLNFYSCFLTEDKSEGKSEIQDMVRNAMYLFQKGGEDILAIGTDYDGFRGGCEIDSPLEMFRLFDALKKAGLSERQIEKAAWKNAERVIESVCG